MTWRKSSYSTNGDACVEIAWRKSSHTYNGEACVEVAWPDVDGVAVRDSKAPTGPTLSFPTAQWRAFLSDLH